MPLLLRPLVRIVIGACVPLTFLLSAGCAPTLETGGFYTRSWYPQHLVLADRNDARTHFVALETFPPGFHYSADAATVPPTQLWVHTGEESIRVLDLTPETLDRWQARYFDAARTTHTRTPEKDRDFVILRPRQDSSIPRFITCGFRVSDGKLLQFEYRVDPTGLDLSRPIDPGPFSFSLGDRERFTLPVPIETGRRMLEAPGGD